MESVYKNNKEGELCVSGNALMSGYWNLEEKKTVFFMKNNVKWYKTGDIASINEEGYFVYKGRIDRMIKRNGYRIELGEIEAVLNNNQKINEVALIFYDEKIIAFFSTLNKMLNVKILIDYCNKHLPLYMLPDNFIELDSLPKTSTHKIDINNLISKIV